jgi:hypothetical protein
MKEDVEAYHVVRLPKRVWIKYVGLLAIIVLVFFLYFVRGVVFRKLSPIDHEGV